jgi:hypothetical protein
MRQPRRWCLDYYQSCSRCWPLGPFSRRHGEVTGQCARWGSDWRSRRRPPGHGGARARQRQTSRPRSRSSGRRWRLFNTVDDARTLHALVVARTTTTPVYHLSTRRTPEYRRDVLNGVVHGGAGTPGELGLPPGAHTLSVPSRPASRRRSARTPRPPPSSSSSRERLHRSDAWAQCAGACCSMTAFCRVWLKALTSRLRTNVETAS